MDTPRPTAAQMLREIEELRAILEASQARTMAMLVDRAFAPPPVPAEKS